MNNFVIGFKRFITNKNVVTIIGVLVVLGILYWGYSSTIKKATNPVSIPVAAKTIEPRTQITNSDIRYKNVAASMVDDNVIRYSNNIIGMYTNLNVTVPEGSPFYSAWLVKGDDLPGNWIEQLNYEKEELGYYMSVSVASTLGNSVVPGSYIDIYMTATDETGTMMFGKLIDNVKILVVHDGSGNNVFKAGQVSSPSKIGFGVSKDMYILLKKAEYLNVNLTIVPRGSTVPENDYAAVRSSTLRDYIDAKTITVEEDIILSTDKKSVEEEAKTDEDTSKEETNKETEKTDVKEDNNNINPTQE